MSRMYPGVNASILKQPELRDMIQTIDTQVRELSIAIARVGAGQATTSGGTVLIVDTQPHTHSGDSDGGAEVDATSSSTLLLLGATDQSINGQKTFLGYLIADGRLLGDVSLQVYGDGGSVLPAIRFVDFHLGSDLTLVAQPTGAFGTVVLPDPAASIVFIVDRASTESLNNKTLLTACLAKSTSSASSGFSISDTSTATNRLRWDISAATGTHLQRITATASRVYDFFDLSAGMAHCSIADVAAGGTVTAGTLGGIQLTGQTANIASTVIANAPGAGMYVVHVYMICTTAGAAGTLDTTLGWTDNVGARTATPAPTLSLTATGKSFGTDAIRVNSGNITISTTITGGSGSPVYALYVAVEKVR